MKISQQLIALGVPIWKHSHEGLQRNSFVSWKQLSLEDSGIMVIQNKAALSAELDDVFGSGKVFFGEPKFFNSDSLHLEMVRDLSNDRFIDLHCHSLLASVVATLLILLVQHVLFSIYLIKCVDYNDIREDAIIS